VRGYEQEFISALSMFGEAAFPKILMATQVSPLYERFFVHNAVTSPSFLESVFLCEPNHPARHVAARLLAKVGWHPPSDHQIDFYVVTKDLNELKALGDPRAIPPLLDRFGRSPSRELHEVLMSLGASEVAVRSALMKYLDTAEHYRCSEAYDLIILLNDRELARRAVEIDSSIEGSSEYRSPLFSAAGYVTCHKCNRRGNVVTGTTTEEVCAPSSTNYGTNGPDYSKLYPLYPTLNTYEQCCQCSGRG
jgi:hypothetical protein